MKTMERLRAGQITPTEALKEIGEQIKAVREVSGDIGYLEAMITEILGIPDELEPEDDLELAESWEVFQRGDE